MTSIAKHTPGPWKAIEGNRGWQIHTDNKAGKGAANVNHWIANIKCESCQAHEEGNARLIAAAPGLLEALKYIAKTWPDDFAARHARVAIAKAEGRS